jgi:hypothetical protein
MLRKTILLTSALVGAELLAGAGIAQAGGMGHFQMPHMGGGAMAGRLCPGVSTHSGNAGFGRSNLNVYAPVNVTTNVNRSTNVAVNRALNVYAPVTVNSSINNSVNINNSKVIDTSTNISVNKEINVRTTNIFNGLGSGGSDHSQGGSWGSHSGHGNWGGGGNMGGGGSNQNNNGNENNNDNSVHNSNTVNNSNSIDASGAIDSFFNGLRGFQ